MIISRVRLIALLFAILTVLFIIPDLLMLPWPASGQLALERIAASLAFVGLMYSFRNAQRMRDAYLALAIMFAIPTLFFLFSYSLLSNVHLNGLAATITATYAFLPLIMVAGLSMFPLTALEGAIFAGPVLLAEIASSFMHMDHLNLSPLISSAWLVIVVAIVATLSGMSQLGFMIALVRTALRDALTGCFSRLSGMELLEIQFIISSRSSTPLALAFIDLDNFKNVNDTYGHDAGDQVLVNAAEHIRASLRTGDMLARWGGEEFILIMPNTFCKGAIVAIERLRAKGLGIRPDSTPMTASIGIAERMEDQAGDWKVLVEIADQRMYAAKQGGKNKSVHSCRQH
ncbi:MAG TPA: GGDEF domain-containing protein [Gallionellaceae bacterium]|nr:GGDEF domain-containing protein [Gallionellaceae bacterium]